MARSLIVLPDDSARPILKAINQARRMLRLKMFVFTDQTLLAAVLAAKRRGVQVYIILNSERRSGEHDNDYTRKALEHADIEVKSGNPAFDVTHEKSLVIDDDTAFVQSLNWAPKNFIETRDYAVVTTHWHDVAEIIEGFEADWHRQAFEPRKGSNLLWSPSYARERLVRFIDEAKHHLIIQNERFQDMVVIESLVRAAQRGVKIDVMALRPHTLKKEKLVEGVGGLRIMDDLGIRIHHLKHLKLHAKILLADNTAAIVGSINFSAGSFDRRRELSIEIRDEEVVDRLREIVHHDWHHSHAIDLSEYGLLADLEERMEESHQLLAIHDRHAGK